MKKKQDVADIITLLTGQKDYLKDKFGVKSISLFGSYARGEETEESDIDFFVEFDEVNFHKLSQLYLYLEKVFEKKINIVHKHDRVKEKFFKIISRDFIHVA